MQFGAPKQKSEGLESGERGETVLPAVVTVALEPDGIAASQKALAGLTALCTVDTPSEFHWFGVEGEIHAKLNADLQAEEGNPLYIPKPYSPVVCELVTIEAAERGKGYGDVLMGAFLASTLARSSELVFLDPNPYIGYMAGSNMNDDTQIDKLMGIYRHHGFRNNPRSNRMWLVRVGALSDSELPC